MRSARPNSTASPAPFVAAAQNSADEGAAPDLAEAPERERASAAGNARPDLVSLIITVLVCSPAAVLMIWPQAFGAQRLPGIAQLIAFRAPLAVALLCAAIVAGMMFLMLPIDHVLFGPAWDVIDARVIAPSPSGGTDHRPIVAVFEKR